jgi:plastocyanin
VSRPALIAVATTLSLLLPGNAGGAAARSDANLERTRATQTASVTVSITDSALKPAVAVVPLGSDVTWRNDGKQPHAIVGPFWASPDLQPGKTYTVRFPKFGEFRYSDRHSPAVTGTVVVLAGGQSTRPPGRARGNAEYRYRATVSLSVREVWTFYSDRWKSTTGTCNAQVGGGLRRVEWTARYPNVRYYRSARFELLGSEPKATSLRLLRESQVSKIAGGPPYADVCQDGRTGGSPMAVHDANCSSNLDGKRLELSFGWSPKFGFHFHNDGDKVGYKVCGPNALTPLDVPFGKLPLELRGWDRVPYDTGSTAATRTEIERLRRGLPVRVERNIDLAYTTDCCQGFNPRKDQPVGTWAGTGAVFHFRAKLVINLVRR